MEERTRQGQILKQTRESKGIQINTVHEATKIPLDALRAIEEGYTIRTLNPFYYRGFIKLYAQYLDVDLKMVLKDYEPERLPQPISKREGRENIFTERIDSALTPEVMRRIVKGFFIIFLAVLFFKIGGCLLTKMTRPRTETGPSLKPDSSSVRTQTKSTKTAESSPDFSPGEKTATGQRTSVARQEGVAPPARQDNVTVTVKARKDSWLRVEADGRVVFQSALNKGNVETWSADEKIELSGKNVSELEFELNGKVIGTLGRRDRRAKKIIFTQNGFSVKQ